MRTFPLLVSSWLPASYASYLQWLTHLLERLGKKYVLSFWKQVCRDNDDGLVLQILSTGWNEIDQPEVGKLEY